MNMKTPKPSDPYPSKVSLHPIGYLDERETYHPFKTSAPWLSGVSQAAQLADRVRWAKNLGYEIVYIERTA